MIVAKIQVSGVRANVVYRKIIPTGIVGAQVELDYAEDIWHGLHKTVVFRGTVTKDVVTDENLVMIPPEVLATKGSRLRVGVYGVGASGNIAIPTLWANLGTIWDAANPSGDTTTDPSLPVWAQIQAMIGDLRKLDTTAKENLVAAVNEALTKGGGEVDPAEIQRIVEDYLAANPPKVTETDPTVPDWAKQPQKPTYTADEVHALPDTYTPPNQTAQQVGADPAGTAASAVSQHNTDTAAHNDLRLALQGLSDRINAALDSDDTTLDQMSEVVAYIKSNKSLIDAITTSKVSVADIVNDLVTNVADKPLSAAQGVAIKGLIDELRTLIPEGGSGIAVTGATVGQTVKIAAVDDNGVPTAWEPVDLPSGGAENDNDWEIINTITFGEEGITSFTIDKDQNGNPFELSDMLIRSNDHVSLGGTSATNARTNFMINGKLTAYNMGNLSGAKRYWGAIATLINGRIYYGYTDFLSNTSSDFSTTIKPMQKNLGILYNDNAITSVGINIFSPGGEYFAVGYELTLWGRRKK